MRRVRETYGPALSAAAAVGSFGVLLVSTTSLPLPEWGLVLVQYASLGLCLAGLTALTWTIFSSDP